MKAILRTAFCAVLASQLASANIAFAQPAPYEINVILPLTGTGAPLGADEQTALQVLEKAIDANGGVRGQPIHFAISDDQSNPAVSLQLATALVQKNVPVILGPSIAATCRAIQPLINSAKTVTYCFSPQVQTTPDGYLYSSGMSGASISVAMLRFLQAQGWRRIALLATTDASGQGGEADTKEALSDPSFKNMTVVDTEYLTQGDLSATAQMTKIKAVKPDAILVYAPGTAFGTALHGIHDVGLDIPVLTTAANVSRSRTKQYDAFSPSELYMQGYACIAGLAATESSKRASAFYVAAMKKSNLAPEVGYCLAWDPAIIVLDALRKNGLAMTSSQLRDTIESLRDFGGVMGAYNFQRTSHRGLSESDVVILRWDKDRDDFVAASALGGIPLSSEVRK